MAGLIATASAFLIWGLCPVFWKIIAHVPALETINHRIVWSFFFLLPVIWLQGNLRLLAQTLTSPVLLGKLSITAMLVASNWLVFIWAVNNGHILDTSLGYYINPLVNVLFGTVFLKERLRKMQTIAVGIATAGVAYLTWQHGSFPLISLYLAVSFGAYGLLRKMLNQDPAVGLAVETLLLTLPCAVYLMFLEYKGTASFLHVNSLTDVCLICTALLTAVPLLLFNIGARLLRLCTVGFLQYIAPSVSFSLAIFVYGEPLSHHQLIAFVCIWTALAVYTVDSTRAFQGSG